MQAALGCGHAFLIAFKAHLAPHQGAQRAHQVIGVQLRAGAGVVRVVDAHATGEAAFTRRPQAGLPAADNALKDGVRRQAIGPVQAGAGHFTRRQQAGQGGGAVDIADHAAAVVVGAGVHGNPVFGDIDAEFREAVKNGREALAQKIAAEVTGVQATHG